MLWERLLPAARDRAFAERVSRVSVDIGDKAEIAHRSASEEPKRLGPMARSPLER